MIVLAMGTYDLLHYGHVDFLRRAASLGTRLVVGVNTDAFAASYRSEPPVMRQEERFYAVQQLGYEVRYNESAGRELIEKVKPDVIAEGSDWIGRDWYAQTDTTQAMLDGWGCILAYIPRVTWQPISASEIKARVRGL